MFVLSDVYFSSVEGARVVWFLGRTGSYKTLSAVATAHQLLKSKQYARCYANIPVTFATSPPKGIGKFDFTNEGYAKDAIYIIDEAALFMSGKSEQIKEIFAFPRKMNQIFLLASVLPIKQISDYCHLFVKRNYNLSLIGIPAMSFLSSEIEKATRKEKASHWIMHYSNYFQKYASKYKPDTMYPIEQWRDRAALYDMRSRRIPAQAVKYYCLNSWGLAEKRANLTNEEIDICNFYMPEFQIDYLDDKTLDLPKLPKKRGFNFIGTEFKLVFFMQVVFLLYALYVGAMFIGNNHKDDPPMQKWGQEEWINFLQGNALTDRRVKAQSPATPTVTVIEWRYENEN